MSSKKLTSVHMGAKVPSALLDDFHRAVERLGIEKRRAVAAALLGFMEAPRDAQLKMHERVWTKYLEPQTRDR